MKLFEYSKVHYQRTINGALINQPLLNNQIILYRNEFEKSIYHLISVNDNKFAVMQLIENRFRCFELGIVTKMVCWAQQTTILPSFQVP